MDLSSALRSRIEKIMKDNKVNGNKLSLTSGLDRSTISKFLKGKNKSITIESITLICQSSNISLKDFFDDKLFDDVEVKD